ncbi:MAG: aquaporin family protein, partial [Mesorhizobium sp.]
TFSGIRPIDLPGFIVAELLGALIALALMGWLLRPEIIRQTQPRKAQS